MNSLKTSDCARNCFFMGQNISNEGARCTSERSSFHCLRPTIKGGLLWVNSSFFLSDSGVVQNKKETMQDLNNCLVSYLEKVCSLETNNQKLEVHIREYVGYSHYFDITEELKNSDQTVEDQTVEDTRNVLNIEDASLAADDFHVKSEAEKIYSSVNGKQY
uniref:IF rod domain-containing protein n=1 Tax=Salvator merianae TaxID=96440 RepID=A0A8D0DXI0_SALMN